MHSEPDYHLSCVASYVIGDYRKIYEQQVWLSEKLQLIQLLDRLPYDPDVCSNMLTMVIIMESTRPVMHQPRESDVSDSSLEISKVS